LLDNIGLLLRVQCCGAFAIIQREAEDALCFSFFVGIDPYRETELRWDKLEKQKY
jgi:hypothetical protein